MGDTYRKLSAEYDTLHKQLQKVKRKLEVEDEMNSEIDIDEVIANDSYINTLKAQKEHRITTTEANIASIKQRYELRIQKMLDEVEAIRKQMQQRIDNELAKQNSAYFDEAIEQQIKKLSVRPESKHVKLLRKEQQYLETQMERIRNEQYAISQTPFHSSKPKIPLAITPAQNIIVPMTNKPVPKVIRLAQTPSPTITPVESDEEDEEDMSDTSSVSSESSESSVSSASSKTSAFSDSSASSKSSASNEPSGDQYCGVCCKFVDKVCKSELCIKCNTRVIQHNKVEVIYKRKCLVDETGRYAYAIEGKGLGKCLFRRLGNTWVDA